MRFAFKRSSGAVRSVGPVLGLTGANRADVNERERCFVAVVDRVNVEFSSLWYRGGCHQPLRIKKNLGDLTPVL
jgi:hypothetical protein